MSDAQPGQGRQRSVDRRLGIAFALGAVAVVSWCSFFAFFPVLVLGLAAAVVAFVLAVGALPRRPVPARWAIGLAVAGGVVALALFVVALVNLGSPARDTVELRASGSTFIARFDDDLGSREIAGGGDDWFQTYATERSSAEITVTLAPGASGPVGCAIRWNGVLVVEQTSDEGQVTCRYDR